jgi:hypothetical protein
LLTERHARCLVRPWAAGNPLGSVENISGNFSDRILMRAGGESVPRLQRSDNVGESIPQPFRTGLTLAIGPYGPRSTDRFLEKHSQNGLAELQIPFDFAQGRLSVPLRRKTFPREVRRTADPSAALGMTKGRAALPWRAVARPKVFFITLGGPKGPCPLWRTTGTVALPCTYVG